LYFEQKNPAGPFLKDKIVLPARESSHRNLLGEIFDKLRIQGRVQMFETKNEKNIQHEQIN